MYTILCINITLTARVVESDEISEAFVLLQAMKMKKEMKVNVLPSM